MLGLLTPYGPHRSFCRPEKKSHDLWCERPFGITVVFDTLQGEGVTMMEEQHFGPIWFIPGENRGKYPSCHSLYIEGGGVLIDPGSDRERLIRLRKDRGVKAVWLSHWHEDHFTHLDLFDDLPLRVSDRDAAPLSDVELFLDWYGMDNDNYRKYWRLILKEQFHFKPRKPM